MKCEQLSTDGLAGILASIDQNQGKESIEVLQSGMKRRVYSDGKLEVVKCMS